MGVLLLIKWSISEMWISVKLRATSTYCIAFKCLQSAVYLPKDAQAFLQNSVYLTN